MPLKLINVLNFSRGEGGGRRGLKIKVKMCIKYKNVQRREFHFTTN